MDYPPSELKHCIYLRALRALSLNVFMLLWSLFHSNKKLYNCQSKYILANFREIVCEFQILCKTMIIKIKWKLKLGNKKKIKGVLEPTKQGSECYFLCICLMVANLMIVLIKKLTSNNSNFLLLQKSVLLNIVSAINSRTKRTYQINFLQLIISMNFIADWYAYLMHP